MVSPATSVADAPWGTPAQVSPTSMNGSQNNITADVGLFDGNAAAVWKTSEQVLNGAFLAKGGTAWPLTPDILETLTAPTKVDSPAVEVATGGFATAAWTDEASSTASDVVKCANRASGGGAFAACSANVFGPSGSAGNWQAGRTALAMNANGDAAMTFEGPGSFGNFSQVYAPLRSGSAGAFSGGSITGNIGIFGGGTAPRPWVAIDPAGDAIAIWETTPSSAAHDIQVAYHNGAGAGWVVHVFPDVPICCQNTPPGDYRVAIDGEGDGYAVASAPIGAGTTDGVVASYLPRTKALNNTGSWPGQEGLDNQGKEARIAADSAGDSVATWVTHNGTSNQGDLYASYRPDGTSSSWGTPVLVASNVDDFGFDEWHQLYMGPSGNTIVIYRSCENPACTQKGLKAKEAPAGGLGFGSVETIQPDGTASILNLVISGDPQGEVLVGWTNGSNGPFFTSLRVPPSPPTPPTPTPPGEVSSPAPPSPDPCALRYARARLFVYNNQPVVRLVIRYRSAQSAMVQVGFSIKGPGGTVKLGKATKRFSTTGRYRVRKHLSEKQIEMVRRMKSGVVDMRIPGEASFCAQGYRRHLTKPKVVSGQTVWFQSDSNLITRP